MDCKDEYILQLCNSLTKITPNKTPEEINSYVRQFLNDNAMLLCKDTTREKDKEPEVKTRNVPTLDMFYVEFNGHVYLADKKNRVYTCNKNNPVEIGHIQENENERILIKYEGCDAY